MRLILVDTCGPAVAVAGFVGEDCVCARAAAIVAGADGWLTPAIAECLELLGGLDVVAVSVGPGAFTGLRVGVAQAMGLAFARGVPMRAVPSLALRAASGGDSTGTLAVIDARKGRVYAQRFRVERGVPTALGLAADLAPEAAASLLQPGDLLVGEGAPLVAAACATPVGVVESSAEAYVRAGFPLCAWLPEVAASGLVPFYLREPDARPFG